LINDFLIVYQNLKKSINDKYRDLFNALDGEKKNYLTWEQWNFAFILLENERFYIQESNI
jgi:hypothetical protein